jgi:hypothetical protein
MTNRTPRMRRSWPRWGARTEVGEGLRDLLRATRHDQRVAREHPEVGRGGRVRGIASDDGHDREADHALLGGVAERLPGDVVFVVDGEPVDAEPGDLVECAERFGDLCATEQLGERVRLVFVQPERHLAGVGTVLVVGEGDEVAVAGAVGDDPDLAAVVRDEGVQHTDSGKFDPPNIHHGCTPQACCGSPPSLSATPASLARGARSGCAAGDHRTIRPPGRCPVPRAARGRRPRRSAVPGTPARR